MLCEHVSGGTRLLELLAQGPAAFGFEGDAWTLPRVTKLIKSEFGVRHHPAHVSKILRRCGWSIQKPIVRGRERDEAAIAQWKEEHGREPNKSPGTRGCSGLPR
jgi:transposase